MSKTLDLARMSLNQINDTVTSTMRGGALIIDYIDTDGVPKQTVWLNDPYKLALLLSNWDNQEYKSRFRGVSNVTISRATPVDREVQWTDDIMSDNITGTCFFDAIESKLNMVIDKLDPKKNKTGVKQLHTTLKNIKTDKLNYPNGVSTDVINELAKKYNLVIKIYPTFSNDPWISVNSYKRNHQARDIVMIYHRRSHLELMIDTDIDEVVYLPRDEFIHKIQEHRDNNIILVVERFRTNKISIFNNQVISFNYMGRRYAIDHIDVRDYIEDDGKEIKEFLSIFSPYKINVHTPVFTLLRSACVYISRHLFVKRHSCLMGGYGTDMIKSFTQYKNCKFYMGIPYQLNHVVINPSYDFIKNLNGVWQISTVDKFPLGDIPLDDCAFPTPMLNFLHSLGIRFTVKFGAYALSNFPEQRKFFSAKMIKNKSYTVGIGTLKSYRKNKTMEFVANDEIRKCFESDKISNDKYVRFFPIDPAHQNSNILHHCYFVGYAAISTLQQALIEQSKDNLLAIINDELITRTPPDLLVPEIWKPSKIVDKARTEVLKTSYKAWDNKPVIIGTDKERIIAPNCGTIGADTKANVVFLHGMGGTGKTYDVAQAYKYLGITYTTKTHKLCHSKGDPQGDFHFAKCVTSQSIVSRQMDTNGCSMDGTINKCPPAFCLDEYTMIDTYIYDVLPKAYRGKAVLLICGDEAQITNFKDGFQLYNKMMSLCDYSQEYLNDRRSLTGDQLIDIKLVLYRMAKHALTLDPDNAQACLSQAQTCYNYISKLGIRNIDTTELPGKLYAASTNDKNTQMNETYGADAITPDKLQGETVTYPTSLVLNNNILGGRLHQYCSIIYSLFSRVQSIRQLLFCNK